MAQENTNEIKETISLIAVLGKDTRAIGKDGGLLWSIPEDMARFKALTMGHPVIMGRKTWESLPEKYRPLVGRTNFVVTRQSDYIAEGAMICTSFEDSLKKARSAEGAKEIFVIGGGELYAQALPQASRLYLTLIVDDAVGDTFFPDYSQFTKVLEQEKKETAEGLQYQFLMLERP